MNTLAKLLSKLPGSLPRRQESKPAPRVDPELEKNLGRAILKKQGRAIEAHRPYPNMPKYQPCDICNRAARRVEKTTTGAQYHCSKCNNNIYEVAR